MPVSLLNLRKILFLYLSLTAIIINVVFMYHGFPNPDGYDFRFESFILCDIFYRKDILQYGENRKLYR